MGGLAQDRDHHAHKCNYFSQQTRPVTSRPPYHIHSFAEDRQKYEDTSKASPLGGSIRRQLPLIVTSYLRVRHICKLRGCAEHDSNTCSGDEGFTPPYE